MLPQGCFTVMAPTRCSLGLESDIRVSHELTNRVSCHITGTETAVY